MPKKLAIIQSIWIGNQLSPIEQLSIKSFLKNGHQFHLYCYQKIENIPKGTVIKDANEIIKEQYIYQFRNSYAAFSDWFRHELLYQKGNFYVDLDVICLKPFDFTEKIIFGYENKEKIGTAILSFPAKHKICKYLSSRSYWCYFLILQALQRRQLNSLKHYSQIFIVCLGIIIFFIKTKIMTKGNIWNKRILQWGESVLGWGEIAGPVQFTHLLKKFKLIKYAKPHYYFYPICYSGRQNIFKNAKNIENDIKKSYAIHLWNYKLSKELNEHGLAPKESFYEQLQNKYK